MNLVFRFFEISRVFKRIISLVLDTAFIVAAVFSALFVRDKIDGWVSEQLYYSIAITVVFTLLIWIRLGLYRAVIRFIDTKALSTILLGTLISGAIFVIASYFLKTPIPRSVPFLYAVFLLVFTGGSRLLVRGLINAQNSRAQIPVIIYGAGASGRQLALSLHHGAEFKPVAFIDDNRELQNANVVNLKVYARDHLEALISKHEVKKILLAIPSSSANERKILLNQLQLLPVEVLTIPGSADLVSGKLQVDTLRRVDIVDLLGREPVQPIDGLFRRCIENKNVMVTGGGGSIGSELCRQIIRQRPMCLVLYEASELALYSIEKELIEQLAEAGESVKIVPVLASVLDQPMIENVMRQFNINTVYHAAAYKHVPLVEYNVASGLRNNVWGTKICAEAAVKAEVENFVLISTDKAVRPTNVMGSSKRLAELVLQALAEKSHKTRLSMVRFGNVLGSSGSVVPLFTKQIAEGGPVTITHPDITRYFMTIPEAAQLVIQAGAMGKGGEVYVLDMGKSVKISDLAKKMIHLSGLTVKSESNPSGDIEIAYSGLRPGEKLYEELLIGENVEGTEHQRIMKARETKMNMDDLNGLLAELQMAMDSNDVSAVRNILLKAPLGYKPSSEIADLRWLQSSQPAVKTSPTDHLRVVS